MAVKKSATLVSIHPPRVGRDSCSCVPNIPGTVFQSTLPVWGGTGTPDGERAAAALFQSTLPVWGGTKSCFRTMRTPEFQSTLPVWGGTGMPQLRDTLHQMFQSTLPVWGGTNKAQKGPCYALVSIHPPRVGRDSKSSQKFFVNFCARR